MRLIIQSSTHTQKYDMHKDLNTEDQNWFLLLVCLISRILCPAELFLYIVPHETWTLNIYRSDKLITQHA